MHSNKSDKNKFKTRRSAFSEHSVETDDGCAIAYEFPDDTSKNNVDLKGHCNLGQERKNCIWMEHSVETNNKCVVVHEFP
ncbi:31154_t:CDS:2, partial [Gigaspora margarita]